MATRYQKELRSNSVTGLRRKRSSFRAALKLFNSALDDVEAELARRRGTKAKRTRKADAEGCVPVQLEMEKAFSQ